MIIAIIGILLAMPAKIYNDYISRARISSLLSGIGSEKIRVIEEIKKTGKINSRHNIVIDTSNIEDKSMLILTPIVVNDSVYWGCNRIGLSISQVPHFYRLNDFTEPPQVEVNTDTLIKCEISQGITYNYKTNMTSGRDSVKKGSCMYLDSYLVP
ncbi:hypothetical protein [Francisella sp. XLW-1]|uniref:hypothetical protein n=1 Tax=Francisella sp. XLW-1 TaxID=2610887 RepID=UPI00168CC0B9|nr:hypothetical protein [Francisella sp. XLW-1]